MITSSRSGRTGNPTSGDSQSDEERPPLGDTKSGEPDEFSDADELSGSPGRNPDKSGLMHTVLDADSEKFDIGRMVNDAVNNNVSMFTPEMFMQKITKNYRDAEKIFGESMIRQLSGYDSRYVEKNIKIPEFKRMVEDNVKKNIDGLKDQGILTRRGELTEDAIDLAAVTLVMEELDDLYSRGIAGKRVHKRHSLEGSKEETRGLRRSDPFRLVNVQQSVKTAIRRGHQKMKPEDLKVHEQEARGKTSLIYGIDTSGSMKGEKLGMAKRAGVALAYQAIKAGDEVGLVAFGKQVDQKVAPTKSFHELMQRIVRLKSGSETDLAGSILAARDLLDHSKQTRHVILLTDALPTVGSAPESKVLEAAAEAAAANISVSIVGIALDDRGEALARKIVDITSGRLLIPKDVANLDMLILEEYDRIS